MSKIDNTNPEFVAFKAWWATQEHDGEGELPFSYMMAAWNGWLAARALRPEGIQIEERVYKDCFGVFCGMADVDSTSGREMFDRLLLKLGVNVRPPQVDKS